MIRRTKRRKEQEGLTSRHGEGIGTPFQKKVWAAIAEIPAGMTVTYKELARQIGKPHAVRAVANAVGANPRPVVVPCHRVVRSDGTLGGYSGPGGTSAKKRLLGREGIRVVRGKVFS